ncbi:hypothetical protein PGT21_006233 [Puccinia graminis f. sp. tritici]|uniref:Uncharacterized protein n=1 Tax=Puccinia graminis f. sp. tritici TaxID=56615 RepID=A0A5B0Q4S1_PUCGR|nr:hypothetical protein PGT21_006233 [Puccinia graminis f. sp. tritici]
MMPNVSYIAPVVISYDHVQITCKLKVHSLPIHGVFISTATIQKQINRVLIRGKLLSISHKLKENTQTYNQTSYSRVLPTRPV